MKKEENNRGLGFWLTLAFIVGGYKLKTLTQKLKKHRHQREMIRTINETMKILTMNGVGDVYGVKREPGESNRHFQKRINRAACELDNSERHRPAPATGAKLDKIAEAHGLTRGSGETDTELQERIRQQVYKKLEAAHK